MVYVRRRRCSSQAVRHGPDTATLDFLKRLDWPGPLAPILSTVTVMSTSFAASFAPYVGIFHFVVDSNLLMHADPTAR